MRTKGLGFVGEFEGLTIGQCRVGVAEAIPEVTAANLLAYSERISTRANSTLTLIDDRDFEEGVERLREAAASASSTEPVVDVRDLLVLR